MSLVLSNAQIHALALEQPLERTLFALRPYIAAGIPADYSEISRHLGYEELSIAVFVRTLIVKKLIRCLSATTHFGSQFEFVGPFVLRDHGEPYRRPRPEWHMTRHRCVRVAPSEIPVPSLHRVMDRRAG